MSKTSIPIPEIFNMLYFLTSCSGNGKVHSGFRAHFYDGLEFFEEMLKWGQSKHAKRVIFCGHSLGGAVAQLAYFYVKPFKVATKILANTKPNNVWNVFHF